MLVSGAGQFRRDDALDLLEFQVNLIHVFFNFFSQVRVKRCVPAAAGYRVAPGRFAAAADHRLLLTRKPASKQAVEISQSFLRNGNGYVNIWHRYLLRRLNWRRSIHLCIQSNALREYGKASCNTIRIRRVQRPPPAYLMQQAPKLTEQKQSVSHRGRGEASVGAKRSFLVQPDLAAGGLAAVDRVQDLGNLQ